jgi:hypothetical protein
MNFSSQMREMMGKQLKALSELYGFDAEEASRQMELQGKSDKLFEEEKGKGKKEKVKVEKVKVEKEKKEKKEKGKEGKKVELPFLGEKKEGCEGVVPSGGLYLQCCKEVKSNGLCGACVKQGEKNGTGEPDNGRIDRRLEAELYEYRTPKGKKCTRYVKVMEEKGWTREEVEEEAERQGKEIPEEHFEEESKGKGKVKEVKKAKEEVKRGRPKEKAKEVDIEVVEKLSEEDKRARDAELKEDEYLEEDEEEQPKKKEKKEKTKEKTKEKKETKPKAKEEKKTKKAKMVVEDEEEGEQEVVCDEYVHTDGKKYYRCADTGLLYTAFGVEVTL